MKHVLIPFCAALGICALGLGAPAAATERPLVLSMQGAEHGQPAPYLHKKDGIGYLYTSYVFDSLIAQGADGSPEPGLADSWQISEDGRQIDLQINAQARWHDGQPVTAQDAAFTFGYMARHPYLFVDTRAVVSAEALDARHLRLRLKARDAGIIGSVLMTLPILPQHIYKDVDNPEQFSAPAALVGSGPYRLVSHDPAQGRYLFEAVPEYYRGAAKFRQMMIADMGVDAGLQALARGKVDAVAYLPAERIGDAEKAGAHVLSWRSGHVIKLTFNTKSPFAALSMRQALNALIDRKVLRDIAMPDAAEPAAQGYYQPDSPWYAAPSSSRKASHDPARASALLEAQGYRKSATGWQKDGTPLTVHLLAGQDNARLAQVLSDQLEGFGLKVALQVLDTGRLRATPPDGNFDLLIAAGSTLGDPDSLGPRIFGQAFGADRFPPDPEIAAALAAAKAAPDRAGRKRALARFQQLYAEKLPSIMLLDPVMSTATSARLMPALIPNGSLIGIPTALSKTVLLDQ